MKKKVVVALGHRALGTTLPEQKIAVKKTAVSIADLVEEGYQVVITHSNGPQVGMIHTAMNEFANKFAKQMSTKMTGVDQFVSALSGGNKQKVVLARWVGKDSDLIILDSPTRGIDVKVKADIYAMMNDMRKRGKSIIMISEEIMELLGMADRILITVSYTHLTLPTT